MGKETNLHKQKKEFWLSLGRALEFEVQPEDKLKGGFVDVSWKKDNLFIGIEIECNPSSFLNFDKFKYSNPRLIIVECLYAVAAKKMDEERKKYPYKILVMNHNLKSNYKYLLHLNRIQNDFLNHYNLKEKFYDWFKELNPSQ